MAGLVPALRPHLRSLWGVAAKDYESTNFLERSVVILGRIREPLLWVSSMLLQSHGDLQRTFG
eukprot:4115495-Prorocentrum_lima.AAC.1